MFLSYKQRAENNKLKIIKGNVKYFKQLCMKEFRENIRKGIDTTIIDFFGNVNYDFEKEISEMVLNEFKKEHKGIEFKFCYRHYNNSYKAIKMIAK